MATQITTKVESGINVSGNGILLWNSKFGVKIELIL